MNGLRSNPTTDLTPVPFVVHAGSSAKRGPPLIAKDARMERANTSDLKDFFRSTGPESGTSESVQRQQTITSPSKSNSTRSIPKYEPREATRSQDNDTAMLAEFLRQGPPGAQRVPARLGVDDLGGRFRDAPSVASTQDSFVSRSIQSSTNSRVGLLDSTRAYNNKSSTAPWEKRGPQHTDDTGLPARKQRRVRDPYAIDGDSEDDPDTGTPRGAQSQGNEESLIDFLRNAEPPSSETKTLSPPLSPSSSASPAGKGYQKKSSSGKALKSRFGSTNRKPNPTRTVSTPTSIYKPNTSNYSDFQSNSYANLRQPQQQQPPSQSNRTYAKENFNGTVSRINGNGVRQARKLARDGREDSTSVRDLAEFLRNTEPPPSSSDSLPPLPPLPIQDDISGGSGGGGGGGSGFTRMFSRRKKGVAA